MTAVSPEDCTQCGGCCADRSPRYIPLFGVDERRMDDRALALTWVEQGRRFMRYSAAAEGELGEWSAARKTPATLRCVALRSTRDRLICDIHEMRPDACRWLRPGSSLCLQGRARARRRCSAPNRDETVSA